MKEVTFPVNGDRPTRVCVNGFWYEYEPGTTANVPDEVAALLENKANMGPKEDPSAYRLVPATIGDVEDMIAESGGGGGGESSALICEGTLDDQTGVYTLETPLADIVEAYQAGRDVLLPIPISDGGSDTTPTYYIPAQAAISAGGISVVTFMGIFHAEGETQYTRVMFAGEQTAEGEIETVYDGPLDVAFAVDMTANPWTVETTDDTPSYSNVTAAIKAGRAVRAKVSLGAVGANTDGYIYAPLQQYFRDTRNDSISEVGFSVVSLIGQGIVEHIEIRWGGSTPGINNTPLTS